MASRRSARSERRFKLKPGLSPAQKKMAIAIYTLLRIIGGSPRSIAKSKGLDPSIPLSKTVIYDLATGNRVWGPKESQLRTLYELALEHSISPLPWDWDELDCMRRAVARPAPGSGTQPIAPVPGEEGDRRNRILIDIVWQPVSDLAVYVSAGNLERVTGIIRHVGQEAEPAEAVQAMISCRDIGLDEVTDTIIGYASTRPDRVIMRIVHTLRGRDRHADADLLLGRALQSERP
jgi:hypothetical protein